MFSKVLDCKRISWVDLERFFEILDCFFNGLKIVDVRCNLDDPHRYKGHWIIWIQFESFVHAELCFRQVSKPVVAQAYCKPDVWRWSRIVIHHLLQNCQTLFYAPFVELNYCLCKHIKSLYITIWCCLCFGVFDGAGLTFKLLTALLAILLGLLDLSSSDLIKTHADKIVWIDRRYCLCLLDEIMTFFSVLIWQLRIIFRLCKVKLVSCQDIHSTESLFLILK